MAATGELHAALIERGYAADPTGGNRYIRTAGNAGESVIDLLLHDLSARSRPVTIGQFTFDSSPALLVPLTEDPITIDVTAVLTNGHDVTFTAKVPTVEGAVILKAFAWDVRREPRDAVDLYNLLLLARAHRADIGRWQLDTAPLLGTRLDAARYLQSVIRAARSPLLNDIIEPARLIALIRSVVVGL